MARPSPPRRRTSEVVVGEYVAPAAVAALVEETPGAALEDQRRTVAVAARSLAHRVDADGFEERGPGVLGNPSIE